MHARRGKCEILKSARVGIVVCRAAVRLVRNFGVNGNLVKSVGGDGLRWGSISGVLVYWDAASYCASNRGRHWQQERGRVARRCEAVSGGSLGGVLGGCLEKRRLSGLEV